MYRTLITTMRMCLVINVDAGLPRHPRALGFIGMEGSTDDTHNPHNRHSKAGTNTCLYVPSHVGTFYIQAPGSF